LKTLNNITGIISLTVNRSNIMMLVGNPLSSLPSSTSLELFFDSDEDGVVDALDNCPNTP
jgi:hypothetical protein